MEYLIKDEPSILINSQTGNAYPFSAEEEVFVVLDSVKKQMISFDFEKKKLSARCIVRLIDYGKGVVEESRATTPKFNIKSTFAPTPYGDSDITFLGGGFTASAVARNGKIGIIASVPELLLPDGNKGIRIEASISINPNIKSFNCLLSYGKNSESLHASIADDINGTIWIGENKTIINGESLQGRHIWKRTSFPKKKERPIAIIYGKASNLPFSCVSLTYDNSFSIITDGYMKGFRGVEWIEKDKDTILITNKNEINIEAKVFASIHEKRGPFRKANTFKYALFSGQVLDKKFTEAVGYLDYPDRLQ
ncbi:MAG: hypothetical protein ACI4SL_04195 [Candidatus Ornithospirochaeta sp.]